MVIWGCVTCLVNLGNFFEKNRLDFSFQAKPRSQSRTAGLYGENVTFLLPGFDHSLAMMIIYYRKCGSASYIVREVHSVRERDTERERERERRK